MLDAILAERNAGGMVVPEIEERDITSNPDWERRYLETIPVVELGDRELALVTSPVRLRALLADILDAARPSTADASAGPA